MSVDSFRNVVDQVVMSPLRLALYLIVFITLPYLTTFGLATEVVIFGMFALAFNLLWGFAGLLSFGHALFLGLGAYTAGLIVINLEWPLLGILALVIVTGLVVGFVIGGLSLRLTGIYFAMITLAFAQFAYELTFTFSGITGGSDGLIGIYRPSLLGTDTILISESTTFYTFVVLVAMAVLTFMYLLSHSTFGRTLRAIRENEDRTEALGVNTYRVKLFTFILSSVIASVAGALWAFYVRFLSPQLLHWSVSGDAVLYTLIGGMESLFGPVAGALALIWVEDNLFRGRPGLLNILIGVLFIITVLFARSGIVGVIEDIAYQLADQIDRRDEEAISDSQHSDRQE